MLATLTELQNNKPLDMRIYNMLCNKLNTYCEVLGDDLPEGYISQISALSDKSKLIVGLSSEPSVIITDSAVPSAVSSIDSILFSTLLSLI